MEKNFIGRKTSSINKYAGTSLERKLYTGHFLQKDWPGNELILGYWQKCAMFMGYKKYFFQPEKEITSSDLEKRKWQTFWYCNNKEIYRAMIDRFKFLQNAL